MTEDQGRAEGQEGTAAEEVKELKKVKESMDVGGGKRRTPKAKNT